MIINKQSLDSFSYHSQREWQIVSRARGWDKQMQKYTYDPFIMVQDQVMELKEMIGMFHRKYVMDMWTQRYTSGRVDSRSLFVNDLVSVDAKERISHPRNLDRVPKDLRFGVVTGLANKAGQSFELNTVSSLVIGKPGLDVGKYWPMSDFYNLKKYGNVYEKYELYQRIAENCDLYPR